MSFALIGKLVFPIVGILIARKVGVEAVGEFAVAQTIFTVIELLRDGGLGASYLADTKLDNDKERRYAGAALASGAVFSVVLFLARWPLSSFFTSPALVPTLAWASACTFASGLTTVPANRLLRDARFRDIGLADTGATAVSYTVALVMAIQGFGFASLVAQMVVRVLLYSGAVLTISRFVRPIVDLHSVRLLWESSANLASNIAYFVYTSFDYFVVKKMLGTAANGAYATAFNIGSKPVDLLSVPVIRTLFVAYAKAPDASKQADYWTRAVGFLALATVPVYALLGFHGQAVINLLYGSDFREAGPVIQLLAVYLGCRAFGAAAGSALVATGRSRLNALAWIPGYAIAVVGIASIREHPTLFGIVAALTAGAVAVYVTNLATAWRAIAPSRQQARVMLTRFAGTLPAILVIAGARYIPVPAWQQLAIATIGGASLHQAMMGKVLSGDWKAFFSKAGLKQMGKSV